MTTVQTQTSTEARIDGEVERSLDQLLLSNRIRQIAVHPRPVTVGDLSYVGKLSGFVARFAFAPTGFLRKGKRRVWKTISLVMMQSLLLVLLRLMVHKLGMWRVAASTAREVLRNGLYTAMGYRESPGTLLTSYGASTDKEGPLLRVCFLLRIMKRYGTCIELLRQRLDSGLPSKQTKRWLSFFLSEIGDDKGAQLVSPAPGRPEPQDFLEFDGTPPHASAVSNDASELRYGVVLPAMFDSDVFRSSILSLLSSDFTGKIIVVEEGNQAEPVCETFCAQLPVTYIKNYTWTGPSEVANLGIERLNEDADVIIFAHSDGITARIDTSRHDLCHNAVYWAITPAPHQRAKRWGFV